MNDRFFVATRKGLFGFERSGSGAEPWTMSSASFLGDQCSFVLPDPRCGTIYAALKHGHFGVKLHRSDDAGHSWNEIATPAYPERPDETPLEPNEVGQLVEWKMVMIWALEPASHADDGSLWCGTLPGGLFHSSDRGDTWTFNRTLWDRPERRTWFGGGYDEPGIHSVCVDPRDDTRMTLGVSCGGVWHTTDRGATWELRADGMRAEYMPPEREGDPTIQDPHLVVQCANNPDAMWAQHHNGVFRSVDRGRHWTEIDPPVGGDDTFRGVSRFGFAVAVHPTDADTAWFVPAIKDEKRVPVDGRFVVTRTRDGGASFDVLDRGLPAAPSYDLVFRHALAIDDTGNRIVMGSTTGNLWITEDQGDNWQLLSANLPPVYAVRWG